MATPVKKWLLRVAPWFLPVGIVAVWQLASSVGWLSTRILPSPEGVMTAFWTLSASGELWQHLAISSWRALIGFSIGGSLGLILGLISGLSRWGERLLDTSIQMLRNVPHLALIPLVILWFGWRVRFRETQHGNVPATHLMLFPASAAPALMAAPSGRYTIVPIVRSAVCSRGSSSVDCGRYDRNRPPVENLAYSVMTIAPASWR